MKIIQKHLEVYGNTIDEPFLNDNDAIVDFPADNNNSASFKFKTKTAGRIRNNGTKDVKIIVLFKNISNFWRIIEMTLIVKLILL